MGKIQGIWGTCLFSKWIWSLMVHFEESIKKVISRDEFINIAIYLQCIKQPNYQYIYQSIVFRDIARWRKLVIYLLRSVVLLSMLDRCRILSFTFWHFYLKALFTEGMSPIDGRTSEKEHVVELAREKLALLTA